MLLALELVPIFICLLCLEGFFTSSEIALVSANHHKLQHLAQKGQRGALVAHKLLSAPDRLFATTLVGSNLAETANVVIVSTILIGHFGSWGELIAMLALPPLILVFAEITPKALARQRPTRLAQKLGGFVLVASYVLLPVTWLFALLSRMALFLTGVRTSRQVPFVTREELRMVVRASDKEVDLSGEEKTIIHRILRFSQITVKEVMVPLIEVTAIPETFLISQVREEFLRSNYSRLLVYRQRIDNIIGMVHSLDLLGEELDGRGIKKLIRPVRYVPETKRADLLLMEMQRQGIQLAAVVDEYGGVVGIVTIEDLLEEIVGEISDEFDQEAAPFKKLRDQVYLVNARMEIETLNEALGLNLPLGNYDTLGGFLIQQMGDIPKAGDKIQFNQVHFLIRNADLRCIKEVELHVEPAVKAK